MSSEQAVALSHRNTTHRWHPFTSWLLLTIIGLGAGSPVYAASNEAAARPQFATLIVTFLFVMGVSQAGIAFSAVTRLGGGDWARPYYRLAELSTMAFAPFAIVGLLLIYFLGREELFYWLPPNPEEHLSAWLSSGWLLFRNLAGLLLFYGISLVYVHKGLQPDMVITSTRSNAELHEVQRQLNMLAPWVLVAFVICNSFLAWDFAMMLVPHWHSTVFPIHYWFGNAYAGTAALLIFPAIVGRSSAGASYFGPPQIRYLSMMISGFMLLWLYFLWSQFFVMWFGNLPRETDTLFRQMYGHYAPYYWTMIAGCFFVPFVALIFAMVNRSLRAMCVLAIGINLGIWINKYLMVIPVYSTDDRLLDHVLDLLLSIGLLVAFVAVVAVIVRRLPMYCHWEIKLLHAPAETFDGKPDSVGDHS